MRQLKLVNGLLIGNKIQIYYDGQFNKSDDPVLLKSIEISETDKGGFIFIELFQKNTFTYPHLDHFAKKCIKEISAKSHKEKLYNLLVSPEYQAKIQRIITDDLQQNWDSETIKDVLEQLSFSITSKTIESRIPIATRTTPSFSTQTGEIKIGQLVRNSMSKIIEFCNASDKELLNLQSKSYSKQIFNINYPFLKKVTSNTPKQDRYGKDKYFINNEYYVITSEWFKKSKPLFQSYIARIK